MGYLALLVSIVVFTFGALGKFTDGIVRIVAGGLIVCTLTLLPGTVINYGVRSANREDRRRGVKRGR